jgi:hypothetical protein
VSETAAPALQIQRFVGAPLRSYPPAPEGVEARTSCVGRAVNSDLRPNRVNVIFDDATQRITKIACY